MKSKRILASLLSAMMLTSVVGANASVVGDSIKLGDYTDSSAETQKLIDNRPDIQRQMESLDRGVVAVKTGSDVLVSWRWLGTESASVMYNVYKDGIKLNAEPLNATNYVDNSYVAGAKYSVSAVVSGTEEEKSKEFTVLDVPYIEIPLQAPAESKMAMDGENEVEMNLPYKPCECSVADLDGDKEYEIVLKWDPRYVRDASKGGYTGDCVIDAYELDGTLMWRLNMGPNIRSGPHDTQFMVYDFDNDGKAEMACRTADGTIAGDGTVIGDAEADWAVLNNGKNLQGPLYLTVFNGTDGTVMDTVPYDPQTFGEGYDLTDWGDSWGNRSERYLGGIACVDGVHTSFQLARGYYTGSEGPLGGRTVIASYHIEDKKIVKDWIFDTKEYDNWYKGKGNHSMSSADVDYDGLDEIIYGALVVDNDGTPMYATEMGHGDAQHTGDLIPSHPGLETYSVHEWKGDKYTFEMRDARTGDILFGEHVELDNGRGCAADIDPAYPGAEVWSLAQKLVAADGTVLSTSYSLPTNFAIWWDGDLGRELQDENRISKYNPQAMAAKVTFVAEDCTSVNSGKANPSLTADIFGDWREETIYPTEDGSALRIFMTTAPTIYRIPALMHDPLYRNQVATQQVCYNQPTHTGYYLGFDTTEIPVPQIYTVENGAEVRNPDLAKKSWSIESLATQQKIEFVIGSENARVNGKMSKIPYVVPYINENDRTMVPLRFIAESLGCTVGYEADTSDITITSGKNVINMTVGQTAYTVNGEAKEMDTVPTIKNDTTLVPIRAIAEGFGRRVGYSNGVVVVADINAEIADAEAVKAVIEVAKPEEAKEYNTWNKRAQTPTVTATVNEETASNVADNDFTTTWKCEKDQSITLDTGRGGSLTRAGFAFADDKPHNVKIECSGNGKDWTVLNESFCFVGNANEKLEYIIGITKYVGIMRFTCLDDAGMEVSEIALIEVD